MILCYCMFLSVQKDPKDRLSANELMVIRVLVCFDLGFSMLW